MGVIFISHSSVDNVMAIKVRDWLRAQGWSQIFLDLDATDGLAPGQRWQEELKRAGEQCAAVVVLVSPNWVASPWCQVEFLLADQLGKRIFPVFIAPTPFDSLRVELKGKFQLADISAPSVEAQGFERLAIGLKRAGLTPNDFPWPPPNDPTRSVYRGLRALEEDDAAILFGRGPAITKGLDDLRRLRAGAPERALVILGASGAGKSSFLRAGLIARLKREDEHFLVLPVIRPERAVLSGASGLGACLTQALAAPVNLGLTPKALMDAFAALRAPVVERLDRIAAAGGEVRHEKPPTIIMPIDQAEELYNSENDETERFLSLVTSAIATDSNALAIFTIRSDSYEPLQTDKRLDGMPQLLFGLRPISTGDFKDVIEGPARLARPPIEIEPELTGQLLTDLDSTDALPLLAFTLERLKAKFSEHGKLTLAGYRDGLGGINGAIQGAIDAALGADANAETLALARRAFVPALVQVDQDGVKRRVAPLSEFPATVVPLLEKLIEQRLLVRDQREIAGQAADTVEVAHEAILRQWPALAGWIGEERDALRVRDLLTTASSDWRRNGASDGWLVHRGTRLSDAIRVAEREDFAPTITADARGYLAACRAVEDVQLARERRQVQRMSDALAERAAKAASEGYWDRAARYALAGFMGADWPIPELQPWAAEAQLRNAAARSTAVAAYIGHGSYVNAIAFSPDGSRLATGSHDNTARIWDVVTGRPVGAQMQHNGPLQTVVFSPDGSCLATLSTEPGRRGVARLWSTATGSPIGPAITHGGGVHWLAFSPDGAQAVTAGHDPEVRFWESASGAPFGLPLQHDLAGAVGISIVAYSPDGRRLVTADGYMRAWLWDIPAGNSIGAPIESGPVQIIAFAPDGTRFAAASSRTTMHRAGSRLEPGPSSGIVQLFDAETGVLVGEPMDHASARVNALAFSADGEALMTESGGTVSLWDARTGARRPGQHHMPGEVTLAAVFSPDGSRLAMACDNTARLLDTRTNTPIGTPMKHRSSVLDVRFSPDGTRLATASRETVARLWDTGVGEEIAIAFSLPHDTMVHKVLFSPDGARLLTTSIEYARLWDARTGALLGTPMHHGEHVEEIAFSPDGSRLCTASRDGMAHVWDAWTGEALSAPVQCGKTIGCAAFSPDRTRLATTVAYGDFVRIWDVERGAPIGTEMEHEQQITALAFSADGDRLVTASGGETVRLWDVRTGTPVGSQIEHPSHSVNPVISPDGTLIATGGSDGTARLWDAPECTFRGVPMHHHGALSAIAFSPDGSRLATASSDGTAQLWDVDTCAPLGAPMSHPDGVTSLAFSPAGGLLATTCINASTRLWCARTGASIGAPMKDEGDTNVVVFSPDGRRLATAPDDACVWSLPETLIEPRQSLLARVRQVTLANGLSQFGPDELASAPELDPELDADVCRLPTPSPRLRELLGL